MVLVIAIYLAALLICAGAFGWAAIAYVRAERPASARSDFPIGPETPPFIVSLYCQYLVAPATAVAETEAMLRTLGTHPDQRQLASDLQEFLDLLRTDAAALAPSHGLRERPTT